MYAEFILQTDPIFAIENVGENSISEDDFLRGVRPSTIAPEILVGEWTFLRGNIRITGKTIAYIVVQLALAGICIGEDELYVLSQESILALTRKGVH